MKHIQLLLLATFLYFAGKSQTQHDNLRLMTYNIRFANEADAPHTWENRKQLIINQILAFNADVIGCQEALHRQVKDLETGLPGYLRIGVGRDDGHEAGEYSPLFIRQDRFDLKASGTFWLSDTPGLVSVGWDAALPRIATWAKLTERNSGRSYFIINTHFDHIGSIARLKSIQLITDFISQNRIEEEFVFFMGDLNTGPESEPYQWIMKNGLVQDPYLSSKHRQGPVGTFNAFNYEHQSDRIDYIFIDPRVKSLNYHVLMESYNNILPSDHWPVMVVVAFW